MSEQEEIVEQVELLVDPQQAGNRVDKWLAENFPEFSRSGVQRLIGDGSITVDGKVPKKNDRLRGGEKVVVFLEPPKETAVLPEDIPLDIVYEDQDLLVVNKPKGWWSIRLTETRRVRWLTLCFFTVRTAFPGSTERYVRGLSIGLTRIPAGY